MAAKLIPVWCNEVRGQGRVAAAITHDGGRTGSKESLRVQGRPPTAARAVASAAPDQRREEPREPQKGGTRGLVTAPATLGQGRERVVAPRRRAGWRHVEKDRPEDANRQLGAWTGGGLLTVTDGAVSD